MATTPAAAQDGDRYTRALAAGYKASFLCSDLFNAGQTVEQVERDDLQRTYASLEPLFPELKADIDRQARTVRVAFDETLPPRVAAWRPHLGCAQLPIGADPASASLLPRLSVDPAIDRSDRLPWPHGDQKAAAKPKGDAKALAEAVDDAFDRRTYGQGSETTAVLVVQNGKIVAERYRHDFDMHMSQRTWSVAKSISATLIGAAVQQGLIDVEAPAPVPEWQSPGDPRAAITTDQLLRMASGLHSDHAGNRTDALYFGGTAVTEQAVAWPLEAAPGTRWRYANNDTLLAIRGLRAKLEGEAKLAFPMTDLFWRIGMTRTVPETDWKGNFILSSQVWTTARDLVRLGLLYLNDGVWNGERILPPGWGDYVSRLGSAQPPAGGYGYGAGFWTFPKGSGLPEDAYIGRGNRGQYLVIVPSRNIVIVRRGYDGPGTGFDLDSFTRDLLAALE
ncbi:serine hydrolase domain-containing protein [Sphingosinicella humi]|uniref:serine hydrolase domain-containing protein n=1 Tax=Allosphingosinicella humi TaxID=2068657 RepID=UPI001FB1493B|nr:serine hydrolase [Sphingosinicella humi]